MDLITFDDVGLGADERLRDYGAEGVADGNEFGGLDGGCPFSGADILEQGAKEGDLFRDLVLVSAWSAPVLATLELENAQTRDMLVQTYFTDFPVPIRS